MKLSKKNFDFSLATNEQLIQIAFREKCPKVIKQGAEKEVIRRAKRGAKFRNAI